jgi:parvulin-like peptidyl-prolyl isomerase
VGFLCQFAEAPLFLRWQDAGNRDTVGLFMKSRYIASVLVCVAGLLQAAETSKLNIPDPVAVVEGKEIKRAELDGPLNALIAKSGKKPEEITDAEKIAGARMIVDNLIIQELVNKRSASTPVTDEEVDARFSKVASQFPDPKQFDAQLKEAGLTQETLKGKIKDGLRGNKWIEAQIAGKADVTEDETKAFYESHPDAFKAPEMVRASHILVLTPEGSTPEVIAQKEKAINAAAARIAKGEDFATVAKEVSEDPGTKEKGGDLDFFPKQAMVPEFSDAAFALKKDEVSKVVKSKYGYHIIKQTDRKEARTIPFDEAKPKLLAYLGTQKKQQVVQAFLKDLVAKADVKNNLPAETAATPAAATAQASATATPEATATPAAKAKKKTKSQN